SCRNRHCPKCQGLARAQWLAERQADLLPVPYFHVVFTVPPSIAAIALQNKAVVYDIIFRAAADTIRVIAADPEHLGAETAMIATCLTLSMDAPYIVYVGKPLERRNLSGSRHIACLKKRNGSLTSCS